MINKSYLKIDLIIKNSNKDKHYYFTTYDDTKISTYECILEKIKDHFEATDSYAEFLNENIDNKDVEKNNHRKGEYNSLLFVKANNKMMRINVKDIIRLQAARNYCDIILKNNQILDVSVPMSEVFEELNKNIFFRINRSSVINVNYIKEICGNMIKLNDDSTFVISDKYRKDFFSIIKIIGTRKRIKCCLEKNKPNSVD